MRHLPKHQAVEGGRMVEAGLMGGGHQDGELKKSAWFSVQAVCREDREQGLRDYQAVSRQVRSAGSGLLHPKNLRDVPSLSAPKRQRREREPCVKSQKCPANSIAIRDKCGIINTWHCQEPNYHAGQSSQVSVPASRYSS